MDDRTPPHNLEIEKSILSSCLSFPDDLDDFADLLGPDDFYKTAHKITFKTITSLHQKNEPANITTVAERLIASGELEKAGGGVALSRLMDAPPATDPAYYADIIRGHAVRRRLIEVSNVILKTGYQKEIDPQDALNKAQTAILNIEYGKSGQCSTSLSDLAMDASDRYVALQKNSSGVTGVPSGFIDLDRVLCGFQKSDLIILAARPSMGKTALAVNIAINAAKGGYPVGFSSLEMNKNQITNRLFAGESGVNLLKFTSGKFSSEDWGRITEAQIMLHNLPIEIDDTPALHYQEFARRARRMVSKKGVKIIFVDYLGLMQGDKQGGRTEEVSSIARNLKATARSLNVPVVALSQLNRAVESRPDKRPQLSDLRDSGALEQDADVVLFIYRPEKYFKDEKHKGVAVIDVAKQRNGPTGPIRLTFQNTTARFFDSARNID